MSNRGGYHHVTGHLSGPKDIACRALTTTPTSTTTVGASSAPTGTVTVTSTPVPIVATTARAADAAALGTSTTPVALVPSSGGGLRPVAENVADQAESAGQDRRHALQVALISSLSVAGAVLLALAVVFLFCRISRLRKGNNVVSMGPPICLEPVTLTFADADLDSGTTRTSSAVEEVNPPILPEPVTQTFADLERGDEGSRESAYDVLSQDLGDGRLAATLEDEAREEAELPVLRKKAHDNGNLTKSLAESTEVVPTVSTLHAPDDAAS